MPRSRQRATLEERLKLDINRLSRQGFVRRGAVRACHDSMDQHLER